MWISMCLQVQMTQHKMVELQQWQVMQILKYHQLSKVRKFVYSRHVHRILVTTYFSYASGLLLVAHTKLLTSSLYLQNACLHILKLKVFYMTGYLDSNIYIFIYIYIYIYIYISLGTLVPNSRDWHEKIWLPNFSHFKNRP